MWAFRVEQFQDWEAAENRNLCEKGERNRGIEPGRLRTCNTLCMLALASLWRRHKLLAGWRRLERPAKHREFVCDQHGHVSFAEA